MVDKEENEIDINRCVHISCSSVGTEVLISSTHEEDSMEYLISEAERLADKYRNHRD